MKPQILHGVPQGPPLVYPTQPPPPRGSKTLQPPALIHRQEQMASIRRQQPHFNSEQGYRGDHEQATPQPVVSRTGSSASESTAPRSGEGSVQHVVIDWTKDLDRSLQKLVHEYSKNWQEVGRSLNIHPEICRHRWTVLVQQHQERQRKRNECQQGGGPRHASSEQQGHPHARTVTQIDGDHSRRDLGRNAATIPVERPDIPTSSSSARSKAVTVPASVPYKAGVKRKQPEPEDRQPSPSHNHQDLSPSNDSRSQSPARKRLREGFFFRVSRLLPGKLQENVGFLALPKEVTFAQARLKITEELDMGQNWVFYLSSLGPVSRKQESTLGTMVSWLTVKNKEDAGSRRNPIPVVIVDKA
jgi:hypothetical protein